MLLIHGWPGSVVEFLDLVAPLTDPIAPAATPPTPSTWWFRRSPATGSPSRSAGPAGPHGRIATAFLELMARLHYDRYGVQGGDVGAFIAPEMGRLAPDHVVGVHVNVLVSFPSATRPSWTA